MHPTTTKPDAEQSACNFPADVTGKASKASGAKELTEPTSVSSNGSKQVSQFTGQLFPVILNGTLQEISAFLKQQLAISQGVEPERWQIATLNGCEFRLICSGKIQFEGSLYDLGLFIGYYPR